jgi:hypothetical protein
MYGPGKDLCLWAGKALAQLPQLLNDEMNHLRQSFSELEMGCMPRTWNFSFDLHNRVYLPIRFGYKEI